MKPKTIFFYFIFLQSIMGFGQFQSPEPTIIRPVINFPEQQITNYAKSYNKKLKKSIIDNKTTEYDINGNIIKETTSDIASTTTTNYTYKNNVLTEKIQSTVSNSKDVKKINKESDEYINDQLNKGEKDVSSIDLQDVNKTNSYIATLDKKNRVESYTLEQKETGGYRPINFLKKANVIYDKNNVIEIDIDSTKKIFFKYNKNLLVKKENITIKNSKLSNVDNLYLYDNNENLVSIKYVYKVNDVLNSKVLDSAVYDNKKNLIWAYNKESNVPTNVNQDKTFITYKYDNNNRLIESSQYENEKEKMKIEYSYRDNLLTKEIKTYIIGVPSTTISSKNYYYNNGKLVEYIEVDPFSNSEKQYIYQYDEDNYLKKITATKKYKNRKTGQTSESKKECDFILDKNILTYKNEIDRIEKYEFFE